MAAAGLNVPDSSAAPTTCILGDAVPPLPTSTLPPMLRLWRCCQVGSSRGMGGSRNSAASGNGGNSGKARSAEIQSHSLVELVAVAEAVAEAAAEAVAEGRRPTKACVARHTRSSRLPK